MLFLVEILHPIASSFVLAELRLVLVRVESRLFCPSFAFALENIHYDVIVSATPHKISNPPGIPPTFVNSVRDSVKVVWHAHRG
jgi:hypothetical protein